MNDSSEYCGQPVTSAAFVEPVSSRRSSINVRRPPTYKGFVHTTKSTRGGRTTRERMLSVNIPAGVEDGTRIRLAGEGEAGVRGGPSGDLYIFLSLAANANAEASKPVFMFVQVADSGSLVPKGF